MRIEIKNPPFEIEGTSIAALEVSKIGFKQIAEVAAVADKGPDSDRTKRLFRERIKRQVRAVTSDGQQIALKDEHIYNIPLPYAMPMRNALDAVLVNTGSKAEILSKGDGLSAPVLVKLGTPLVMGKGDPITEIEIKAETLGQLEDAIIAETSQEQAMAVLTIAKPVNSTLQALPSWALDQITVSDGVFIMTKVLPSFFGQAENS
ncbi:hypothetical protein [Neoaquamicrobium sediminum]|uniref:hypothetical protein n=1 Tax=Neoaquamicrobium sediminum TaxID=1849104 RepID=UPI0040361ECF